MNYFILFSGIFILALVFIDVLWTTIWIDGGSGPVTKLVSNTIWKIFLKVGRDKHSILSIAGPVILFKTAALWVLLLWLGWGLIFLSQNNAITGSTYFTSTNISDTFWYTGYTLLTVGNGDFKPTSPAWQILSTFVAFSGMTLITLAVTYFLSVVSAVVNKKTFASQVFALGSSPADIFQVLFGRNEFLNGNKMILNSLSNEITKITQQYKAYPILRFYHASDRAESDLNAVAILDDALTLISIAKPEVKKTSSLYISFRHSIDNYMKVLGTTFEHTANDAPPLPNFDRLNKNGFTLNANDFENTFDALSERRKKILGLLHGSGWQWR